MSLSMPASGRGSVFGGIALRLAAAMVAVLLVAAPGSAQGTAQPAAPVATAEQVPASPVNPPPALPPATVAAQGAAMPAGAVPGPGAPPNAAPAPAAQTQAAMSFPLQRPYVPPSLVEPVSVAACRSCRENCFRDYGGPCADETCARALPLCMRNCWYAVCR